MADAAPDWAALEAAVTRDGGNVVQCRICRYLEAMPAEGREVVQRLLEMPAAKAPHQRIADGLDALGYKTNRKAVENHRSRHMGASA